MKSIKYTMAALAVIAIASVSTAQAQITPNGNGDLLLGIFNSTNSLEVDLGAYSTLTNGETWDLQSIPTVAGTGLTFNISAAGGAGGAGGLGGFEIVTTTTKVPTTVGSTSTETTAITAATGVNNIESGTDETPSGANYLAYLDSSSAAGSFKTKYNNNGFGFGTTSYALGQTYTGSNSVDLYDLVNGNAPVDLGTFSFTTTDGDTVLTFDSLAATPEPSAYALGLCAIALFWVLKRRSSTIA
jgi:hypothetical protein